MENIRDLFKFGSFKGDVARGVLFLDVRYNDLEVVNGYPDGRKVNLEIYKHY